MNGNPLFSRPLGGMEVHVVDAQRQARTPCDVPVRWVRPKPPAKRDGRKGTRRGWKRKNPPHMIYAYREPTDVLVLHGRTIIATERQYAAIKASMPERGYEPVPAWGYQTAASFFPHPRFSPT